MAPVTDRRFSEPMVENEVEETGDDQYRQRWKKPPEGISQGGQANRQRDRRAPELLGEVLSEKNSRLSQCGHRSIGPPAKSVGLALLSDSCPQ